MLWAMREGGASRITIHIQQSPIYDCMSTTTLFIVSYSSHKSGGVKSVKMVMKLKTIKYG